MHNDNNWQQDWQNYTACFCSKLTPNDTHNSLRSSVNALFDLHGLFFTFICYLSVSVLYWLIQFHLFPNSNSIYRIIFFFLFYSDDPIVGLLHKFSLFYSHELLLSLRVLCVSSFCTWTKSHWFSSFRCSL